MVFPPGALGFGAERTTTESRRGRGSCSSEGSGGFDDSSRSTAALCDVVDDKEEDEEEEEACEFDDVETSAVVEGETAEVATLPRLAKLGAKEEEEDEKEGKASATPTPIEDDAADDDGRRRRQGRPEIAGVDATARAACCRPATGLASVVEARIGENETTMR